MHTCRRDICDDSRQETLSRTPPETSMVPAYLTPTYRVLCAVSSGSYRRHLSVFAARALDSAYKARYVGKSDKK